MIFIRVKFKFSLFQGVKIMQKLTQAKYRTPIKPIFAIFHSIIIESLIFSHFFEIENLNLSPDRG